MMAKPIYCIICQNESEIGIESVWTSAKKAEKRFEELNQGTSTSPDEDGNTYTFYYLNACRIST